MTSAEASRRALSLPEVQDDSVSPRLAFSRSGRGLAWSWLERVAPRKPRVVRPEVLAIRCLLEAKAEMMAAAPDKFFEDDHYRGYPAVLVRLAAVSEDELASLLEDAWQLCATPQPKRMRSRRQAG